MAVWCCVAANIRIALEGCNRGRVGEAEAGHSLWKVRNAHLSVSQPLGTFARLAGEEFQIPL